MGFFKSGAITVLALLQFTNTAIFHSDRIDHLIVSVNHTIASQSHNRAIGFKADSYQPIPKVSGTSATSFNANANGSAVYDLNSGLYVQQHNIDKRLAIASLTKLVTAIVIVQGHEPNEVVTIPKLPVLDLSLAQLHVTEGMKFPVTEMIKALLVSSSADVADALAIWDSGSVEKFADKMNKVAADFDLKNTHFTGAIGEDNANHYSTVADMLVLAQIALAHPNIKSTVGISRAVITSETGEVFVAQTTNALLGKSGNVGVKTGTTLGAGQCYIGLFEQDDKRLLTIVLNSQNRFAETQNMVYFANTHYIWI